MKTQLLSTCYNNDLEELRSQQVHLRLSVDSNRFNLTETTGRKFNHGRKMTL